MAASIYLKAIPDDVFERIIDKQYSETKKKKRKVNISQAVIMLLKELMEKEKSLK